MTSSSPAMPPPSPEKNISNHSSVETNQESNIITTTTTVTSIDDIVERCMSTTDSLFFPFLASIAWIFDAQQTFISIFSASQPSYNCTSSSSTSSSSDPRHISIISDFSLECSSPALLALLSSSFYAGCLVGGLLLASLADSYVGRKNTLVLTSLTMSLTAALTALSPNLPVYAALRFACGFARANVGTTAYVLSSELVPRRNRNRVNTITFFLSTFGFLTLPLISFLNRTSSWRLLYLYTSIPSLCYTILLHFYMKESPRWLLVQGKTNQAIKLLTQLSSLKQTVSLPAVNFSRETKSDGLYSAARIIWKKRWALRRLVLIVIVSFGVGMMYYGIPLNLGNLNANFYISAALNAVAEIPSAFLILFLGNALSRRRSMIGLIVLSGSCSLACVAMGGWLAVAAEMVAFFAACSAFIMVMIYTVELFPTCVRNSAIAVVRQAVVLGGVVAPALVEVGRRRRFLSFGVLGIVIMLCGMFVVFLPETKGREICDLMEEEETKMMEANNVINISP